MQISNKTAVVVYFIILPILVITGYTNNIVLMMYMSTLFLFGIILTIFEER